MEKKDASDEIFKNIIEDASDDVNKLSCEGFFIARDHQKVPTCSKAEGNLI
jgi:hypothetical protein